MLRKGFTVYRDYLELFLVWENDESSKNPVIGIQRILTLGFLYFPLSHGPW